VVVIAFLYYHLLSWGSQAEFEGDEIRKQNGGGDECAVLL
jgi:hypothetical protein